MDKDIISETGHIIKKNLIEAEKTYNMIYTKISEFSINIISAIFLLIAGFWISSKIKKILEKKLLHNKIDNSIIIFIMPIIHILLKVIVIIFVVDRLGLNVSGFIAALGGVGLAIGLALQGSLSNFAAGILIIIFKPFRLGDHIISQNHEGIVESINVLYTKIATADSQIITLPNGSLFNNPIINFTTKKSRRININIGVSYNQDINKCKKVLMDIISKNNLVEKNKEKTVEIISFDSSSINLIVRCYTKPKNYWNVFWKINKDIKDALDQNLISMPYPHREIIIKNYPSKESL